jgi:hypothetical protein
VTGPCPACDTPVHERVNLPVGWLPHDPLPEGLTVHLNEDGTYFAFRGEPGWQDRVVIIQGGSGLNQSHQSLNSEGSASMTGMDFGSAIKGLKAGHKLTRSGWNGKGMYLYLVGPGRYPPSTDAGREIAKEQQDGLVPYRPYIAMVTVDGDVVPWLASQSDVLAEDWELV